MTPKEIVAAIGSQLEPALRADLDRLAAVYAQARAAARRVAADTVTEADRNEFARTLRVFNQLKLELEARHKTTFDTADLHAATAILEKQN